MGISSLSISLLIAAVPVPVASQPVASEVPMAILVSSFNRKTMAGTMMMPPPTPQSPLMTPLTRPIVPAIKNFMGRLSSLAVRGAMDF